MAIPLIPVFAGTSPNRNTQSAAAFTINSIEWLDYQLVQIDATNVSINGINVTATQVTADALTATNAAAAASSSANFKGRWVDLVGALSIPASVERSNRIYNLLENLADVTLEDPLTSDKWLDTSKIYEENAIIDGRFDFWFEAVSQTSSGYGSDTMWINSNVGSTKVHTQELLTPGVDLPSVPTAKFFSRTVVTSVAGASNLVRKEQRIENAGIFAGKTIVLSFNANVDTNKNIAVEFSQNFGTGGSPSATVTSIGAQKVAIISGTLARYEVTIDIPSLSGKTLGTNDDHYLHLLFWLDAGSTFDSRTDTLGQQSGTFDIAAVQIKESSVSTRFEEECTGESLLRVNRYFQSFTYQISTRIGGATTTNAAGTSSSSSFSFERMRANPTISRSSLADFTVSNGITSVAALTLIFSSISVTGANMGFTYSALTNVPHAIRTNANANITVDSRL